VKKCTFSHLVFSSNTLFFVVCRNIVDDSEKRYKHIHFVCIYIFGASIGILLGHLLALLVEIIFKTASIVGSLGSRVHAPIGDGFSHVLDTVKYICDVVKKNVVAVYTIVQTVSTIVTIAMLVYHSIVMYKYTLAGITVGPLDLLN